MRYLVFIFSLLSIHVFSMSDVDDNLVKAREVFDTFGNDWRNAECFAHRSEFKNLTFSQMAKLIVQGDLALIKARLVGEHGQKASKRALMIAREKIKTADRDLSSYLVMQLIGYGECGEQSEALSHALVMAGVAEVSIYCINELRYNHAFVVIKDNSGQLHAVDRYLGVFQPLEEFWASDALLSDFRRVLNNPEWTPPLSLIKQGRLDREEVAIFIEQTRYAEKYQKFHAQIMEETELLMELFANDEKLSAIKCDLQRITNAETAAEIGDLIRGLITMFNDFGSCNVEKVKNNLGRLANDCGLPAEKWFANLTEDSAWLYIPKDKQEEAEYLVNVLKGLAFPDVELRFQASKGRYLLMVKKLSNIFGEIRRS